MRAVLRPRSVHLRSRGGGPLGPLPLRSVEILYVSRILSESTPISLDGGDFRPIAGWPELELHLRGVREQVAEGLDPWAPTDDIPTGQHWDLSERPPIAAVFFCASGAKTGILTFESDQAKAELFFLDGRIVDVSTETPELSLAADLIERGAVPQRAVEQAVLKAPSLGGDLGAALISAGAIAPHLYLERLLEWARMVVSTVAMWDAGQAYFSPARVDPPAVPLAFDRLGVLFEAVRGMPRGRLDVEFEDFLGRELIPASADEVTLEDLKLPPRELRVLKGIDGMKTVAQLVGEGEQATAAMRSVYLALSIGMVVLGDDRRRLDELEEAGRLRDRLAGLEKKTQLEVLGAKVGENDDQIHSRYMVLAKELHPDKVRTDAAPELIDVRRKLFALVQSAYESTATEEKRESLRKVAEMGIDPSQDEKEIVRAVLEAETDFKKAEVLIKVKRVEEALSMIDSAIKKKPADLEFKVHRAYYKFLASKASADSANLAISEITALIRGAPELLSAYLFLGRLNKTALKEDVAMKFYKKVIQFDPRNHEAASEIRLFNMRKEKEKRKKWL